MDDWYFSEVSYLQSRKSDTKSKLVVNMKKDKESLFRIYWLTCLLNVACLKNWWVSYFTTRLLQTPFSLATQGILWIAGQVEPAKLQLATAPSSSAVQERVVQAAAKHGPLASEDEPESDVELELDSEQEPEGESVPYLSTEEPNAMRARPEESSPPSQLEWGCPIISTKPV